MIYYVKKRRICMKIKERIAALRRLMKEKNIDIYLIPSSDFHQSEYVGDYFKCREFMTGFTGSAGTALISQTEACLWTDGRYFIQAEQELKGSDIKLMKSGEPGVPSIMKYLQTNLPQNGILGFDGRVISAEDGICYAKELADKNVTLFYKDDLVNEIWPNRPSLPKEKVFLLEQQDAGQPVADKISKLREEMRTKGVDIHPIISLDDIAWLLNFRGHDTASVPVALCYAIVTMNAIHLFIDEDKLSQATKDIFAQDGVVLHSYNDIYDFMKSPDVSQGIMLDMQKINFALYADLPKDVKVVKCTNPTTPWKAMKNPQEIENTRSAHLKDAIAHTKFMYWVKNNWNSICITEMSASEKLESLRAEQEGFLWPSFEPISAFGEHAAMCHYSSSKETDVQLTGGHLFLTDTGGHYMDGSTDITRTIAIGDISQELKTHFTNVLRGNLALANINFLYGCTGENLDILARQFLWNMHLDYKHGTGHGVGHLLSVHEGPCSIRWNHLGTPTTLEEGMILSDEPGIYIEGSHGIRLENELLVCKDIENEYGQFMRFEVLTYVPFDLDAIDKDLLSETEKAQLNAYHKKVYELVSPHLTLDERNWLKEYTREI